MRVLTVGVDNFLQTVSLKYREIGNRALAAGHCKIKKNLLKNRGGARMEREEIAQRAKALRRELNKGTQRYVRNWP